MKKFVPLSLVVGLTGFAVLGSAETPPELDLKRGRKVFETTCIVCHGSDGKGAIPGVPNMTRKDSRLLQGENLLVTHVVEGFQSPGNPLAMPPKGGNPALSEVEIREAVAYMRARFAPKADKK